MTGNNSEEQKESKALYYPYPRIENIDTLKRALLLYDSLSFIYPSKSHEGVGTTHIQNYSSEKCFVDDYIKRQFFKIISPGDIARQYSEIMLEAYEDDMQDMDALRFAPNRDWWIYQEKIPETILDHHTFSSYRVSGYSSEEYEVFRIPFAQGESVMISQAILSAMKFSLTPFTDDPIHQYFFERRLQRGLRLYNNPQYREEKMKHHGVEFRAVDEIIQRKAVEIALPSLKDVDIEEIVEFRHDHKDTLTTFRNGVNELTNTMQAGIADENFDREVYKIVNRDIKPTFESLKDDSRVTLKEFACNIVRSRFGQIVSVTTPAYWCMACSNPYHYSWDYYALEVCSSLWNIYDRLWRNAKKEERTISHIYYKPEHSLNLDDLRAKIFITLLNDYSCFLFTY